MIPGESEQPVFDPYAPDFIRDPYPVYSALRSTDPVHKSRFGYWVLTTYDNVNTALTDTRLSNRPSRFAVTHSRNRERYSAADVANNIIPFQDAPEHTAARKLISKAFFTHLRTTPPAIEQLSRRLLDDAVSAGHMDIVKEFATPLAVGVIADLLGLPEEDHKRLRSWSHWFFYLFSPIPSAEVLARLNRSLDEFRVYVADVVEARRTFPKDDLISRLVTIDDGGKTLTNTQIIDTCMLLFADGVENVDSGIAGCLLTFLQTPNLIDRLSIEPESIPSAIREALRLSSPGQFIAKIARQDLEIGGHLIRTNEAVLLVLASANRDDKVFERPDLFILDRTDNRHLTFGHGHHACIGAPLVEMEMEIAFKQILKRYVNLRLAIDELRWEARMGHRWLVDLPIRFDARK
ncbi:MAG: cytochrome P450 [Gammaproteobacteria bacterium]|nr:cytochrome P450 [Gammaproteobacteria bacterium]